MDMKSRIKALLPTLKTLCPLECSGDDSWLTEKIFNPCSERYKFMEALLSKLDVPVPKILGNQISSEDKDKGLLRVLSSVGICDENDLDVIKGTASPMKHLMFWEILINTASNKSRLNNSNDESFSEFNTCERNISNKYSDSCSYQSKMCESINVNHLFHEKIQMFPSLLEKEINSLSKSHLSVKAKEIKKIFSEENCNHNSDIALNPIGNICLQSNEYEDIIHPEDENIQIGLEDKISESLINLQNYSSKSFNDAYNNLKPYLSDITAKEFTDIGPEFNATERKLDSVLQFKSSSNLLKSSDSDLEILTSDVSNIQIASGLLSDNKLSEYISCLSESKEKK